MTRAARRENAMEKSLIVVNSSQSTCGGCNSSGCGTCAPAPSLSPTSLSRREFGYAALLASAGTLLAGCSKEPSTKQAAQSEPAATTTPGPAPTLSPDLEVVKESKLPIMTTLEEFYKIPDGLCTAAARCRHCHHPLLFLERNGARSQHSDLARGLGRYG